MIEENFLWGAATSSHQVEGGNHKNDWWAWEAEGNVEGGVSSGTATDHWSRFRDDLRLAKNLGLNSYRFSVEWSRIEPQEGKWDEQALDWYRDLLLECESLELKPMLTLHHFTLPKWFADDLGFASDKSVDRFKRFVTKVVDHLGAHVPLWCTLNEPMVLVSGSYLGRFMPPAIYSPKAASKAIANLLRCHIAAYQIIHSRIKKRVGPWANETLLVGYAHNMIRIRPDRRFHPLEQLIARKLNHLYNFSWIEATLGLGQKFHLPGLLPRSPIVVEAIGQKHTDFIGINYYTKAYVQWRPRAKESNIIDESPVGLSFARRKEVSSDLGWAIYPRGLGSFLKELKKYNTPIFITENGIADKEDVHRPQYLLEHLREVAIARKAGIDVRGYFHWSLLDNFEWVKGFSPRFGLYSVDYSTFERTMTKSARKYQEIIRSHDTGPPSQTRLDGLLRALSGNDDECLPPTKS